MGVKLMTGATGEQNIQAADDRECLAGITGLDNYVFPTGSQLKATLVDANTVTIGTGAGSLQGSRFRCSTTTTVNIQSGTQGQFRHDIVGLHFSRETSGREGLEFQVLTGEPAASEGAAADPAYTAGDLLKGDAEAFMPLYRVKLSGINAADPEPMFSVLTPLATLGDSVSQAVLLLSEDLTVPGGKMRVEVYDMPAIKELVMRFSGNVRSTDKFFADYYTTGKIPKDKLPSTSVSCALAQYEGTWGRFCARGCIVDDGRARLSIIVPQAIQTGYTSECHITYAF